MPNLKLLSILNFTAYLLHVLLAYLSNQSGILSPDDVGDISNRYDTVFAPAGITFAIWGVIYLALFAFCVYHLVNAFTKTPGYAANRDLSGIGWLFLINNLATAMWLLVWVNGQLLLSVVLISIQLITLSLISIRLHIFDPRQNPMQKIFTQLPLSIYFAWICIATIANVSAWLVSVRWDGWGISGSLWTIVLIGAAVLLSLFIILVRKNIFFGPVILWALYGIVLKRQQTDAVMYQDVIRAAWAAIAIVALAEIVRIIKNAKVKTVQAAA